MVASYRGGRLFLVKRVSGRIFISNLGRLCSDIIGTLDGGGRQGGGVPA
jgi:hypothetical protein